MVVAGGGIVVAGGGVVVGVEGMVVAGSVVVVNKPSRAAMASWKAARVAASTSPVGSTPSSVWKAWSAAVSSSVHSPSMGPVQ